MTPFLSSFFPFFSRQALCFAPDPLFPFFYLRHFYLPHSLSLVCPPAAYPGSRSTKLWVFLTL